MQCLDCICVLPPLQQKQKTQMVVARQLNVQRPGAIRPLVPVGQTTTTTSALPTTHRPILPLPRPKIPIPSLRSSNPYAPLIKSPPSTGNNTSMLALRAFNQNQARRVQRNRLALSSVRKKQLNPTPVQQNLPQPPPAVTVANTSPSVVS